YWKIKSRLQPYFMSRIVDIPGAFSFLRPDSSVCGKAIIKVSDEHAPWNAGTWAIEAQEGRVTATRSDAAPGLTLDIRALSQAYCGPPSLIDIRVRGLVTVLDEQSFQLLSALLPPKTVWTDDEY